MSDVNETWMIDSAMPGSRTRRLAEARYSSASALAGAQISRQIAYTSSSVTPEAMAWSMVDALSRIPLRIRSKSSSVVSIRPPKRLPDRFLGKNVTWEPTERAGSMAAVVGGVFPVPFPAESASGNTRYSDRYPRTNPSLDRGPVRHPVRILRAR